MKRGCLARRGISVCLLCASVALASCAGSVPRPSYFDGLVGWATQADVIEELGRPDRTIRFQEGTSLWVYRYGQGSNCWAYNLRFGVNEILRKWDRDPCDEAAPPRGRDAGS